MPNRPILEINLDDSAFQEFQHKFTAYQELLKTLPAFWTAAGKEIEGQKSSFEKIRAEVAAAGDASSKVEKSHGGINKLADATAISFGLLSTHGKHFAANIHQSTLHLMKWTKLTSVFSGLLGAGGLFAGLAKDSPTLLKKRRSPTCLAISQPVMRHKRLRKRSKGMDRFQHSNGIGRAGN